MQPKFTLKRTKFFLKLCSVFFFSFCLIAGKVNAQCTWTASTVYPVPVLDQATATVGTTLYSFAGVSNGAVVTNSYKFDGTTWTAIAAYPAAVEYPSAVTDGTNVYIMGGADGSTGAPQTSLYRYNVAANTYTALASFSTATWNQAAVFLNGKIYKFCGTGAAATGALEIYNIATNTWSAGATCPSAVSFPSGCAIGNFIYEAGGIVAAGTTKTYRYDPAGNVWDDASIADLPATRWGSASAFYNGGFVMAGGYAGGDATANIATSAISWDPVSNSWSTLPSMTSECARMTGAVLNGSLYVIGGRTIVSAAFNGSNNNQKLNCIPLTACSGAPTPGNTLSSINPVCPTLPFTLSLQSASTSGVTYQWQSSSTGAAGSYVPVVPAAIGSTYTTSETANTYFRCLVTCTASGQSTASNPILENVNTPNNCYCVAGSPDVTFEKISRVQFNTIDNSSNSTGPYENFTNLSTTVIQTQIIPITVTISTGFSTDQVKVWIDYNQNGSFEDPGELVYTSGMGAGPDVGSITIPPTATTGSTRMRVRLFDSGFDANPTSCGNTSYGQVEDYTVNIQPCIPGTYTTQSVSQSVQCGSDATFTVAAVGSALTYHWQYKQRPDTVWQYIDGGGYPGVFTGARTNSLTLKGVSGAYSGYRYRNELQGPCMADNPSDSAILTVIPLVATVSPTSATICVGTIVPLTITNTTSAPVTSTFSSGPISIAVPDNTANGVQATIPVSGIPAGSVISDMTITLNMTHTYCGDMLFNLKAPNAKILALDKYLGASGGQAGPYPNIGFLNTKVSSNGVTTFLSISPTTGGPQPLTGTFKADAINGAIPFAVTDPAGFVSNATGFSDLYSVLNGTWTLAMADGGPGDVGVLTSWSISVTYTAPVFATGTWTSSPAAPNTMFTDPAATVAYTGTPVTTIYVKPAVNTNYTVVVKTAVPCTSGPVTIPVSVTNPIGALTVPPSKTLCVGSSGTITATATGGPITWQWQVSADGGLTYTNLTDPSATTATLSLTNVTQIMNLFKYKVIATASPCGTVTSTVTTLNVIPLPVVTITPSTTSLLPAQTASITATSTPAAASYSWTLNGSPISGNNTNTISNITIDGFGTYQATVTDVNGCSNKSNIVTIGASPSARLWIYPNPTANGKFQVRLFNDGAYSDTRIVTIYSATGKRIMEKVFFINNIVSPYQEMDFDLSSLSDGIYLVKVAGKFSDKIVSGFVVIHH